MKDNLKLYVWEDVLVDYTTGIMFSLAHNAEEARELIKKKFESTGWWFSEDEEKDLLKDPTVFDNVPCAFFSYGGG